MKRYIIWILLFSAIFPGALAAQEGGKPVSLQFDPKFEPAEFGLRYDDNVYRSPVMAGRFSDGIYTVGAGGALGLSYDVFRGNLAYHLGADQYLFYSALNNLKNDFDLMLSEDTGDLSFY